MNWLKEKLKKFKKWLIMAFIGGVVLAAVTSPEPIPQNFLLKETKDRIYYSKTIRDIRCDESKTNCQDFGDIIQYAYVSRNEVGTKILSDAADDKMLAKNKIDLSKKNIIEVSRNFNRFTFKLAETDEKITYASVFYGGIPFVKEIATGKWYQIEFATTTIAAFAEQTKVAFGEKIIKSVFAVTSTFYPDPNVEVTTVDGKAARVDLTGQTFANMRSGLGTEAQSATAGPVDAINIRADTGTNTYDVMSRDFFLFDTSSIPDGDTIDSATFAIVTDTSGGSALGGSIVLVLSTPASNTDIVEADFEGTISNTTLQSDTDITYAAADAAEDYRTWTLNSTGLGNILKTGVTKFGLKSSFDQSNTAPTWVSEAHSYVSMKFADTVGTASDPKLVVVHTGAAVAPSIESDLIIFE